MFSYWCAPYRYVCARVRSAEIKRISAGDFGCCYRRCPRKTVSSGRARVITIDLYVKTRWRRVTTVLGTRTHHVRRAQDDRTKPFRRPRGRARSHTKRLFAKTNTIDRNIWLRQRRGSSTRTLIIIIPQFFSLTLFRTPNNDRGLTQYECAEVRASHVSIEIIPTRYIYIYICIFIEGRGTSRARQQPRRTVFGYFAT